MWLLISDRFAISAYYYTSTAAEKGPCWGVACNKQEKSAHLHKCNDLEALETIWDLHLLLVMDMLWNVDRIVRGRLRRL